MSPRSAVSTLTRLIFLIATIVNAEVLTNTCTPDQYGGTACEDMGCECQLDACISTGSDNGACSTLVEDPPAESLAAEDPSTTPAPFCSDPDNFGQVCNIELGCGCLARNVIGCLGLFGPTQFQVCEEDLSEDQVPFEAPSCSQSTPLGTPCSPSPEDIALECATPGLAGVCSTGRSGAVVCVTRQEDTLGRECLRESCICAVGLCIDPATENVCSSVTLGPFTPAPLIPDVATCAGTDIEGIAGTNDAGSACCPLGCMQCGGQGCGRSGSAEGLRNTDCCINGVLNNQDLCSVSGQAPCIIDEPILATPAPVTPSPGGTTCADTDIEGIAGTNDAGSACCPLGCMQCGGQGCGRSGSAEGLKNVDCCINGVLNNQDLCSVSGAAPCVL